MAESTALELMAGRPALLDNRREFGKWADAEARAGAFDEYRLEKAANTLRRQDGELQAFGEAIGAEDLATNPAAWTGITWGMLAGFKRLLIAQGYSIGSVNNHLSTIKVYAGLAVVAGTLAESEYAMMRLVKGYIDSTGAAADEKRVEAGVPTRRGFKKSTFRVLTCDQADAMKANCGDTPQGRRDHLILTLLLDLGMRVSEAAALQVQHFDVATGELTVWRRKTRTRTIHELHNGPLTAMLDYLAVAHPEGQLLMGSRRGGSLSGGMGTRAVFERVRALGTSVGIPDLAPHDLRHTSATKMARAGASITALKERHGWKSAETAIGYVEANRVDVVE